ncbi:MAG: WYL domain-containing protein [Clostridia bacterium]|nr:WYL domain-containing protein [Clostridia bacterium]
MIFSELYSAYYNTVAAIISRIIDGEHSERELQKIVTERAFLESALTVMPSLKSEKWQLVHSDMTTPIKHIPTMPLTNLQKQWLKAISLDPRIKLFDVRLPDLDGVEPLFTKEDYFIYDKYGDGDSFEDEEYVRQFRVILNAIRNNTQIKFEMTNRSGKEMYIRCRPIRLEYSEKDDKFRVITEGWHGGSTINLAKMRGCMPYTGSKPLEESHRNILYDTVTVRLRDERNALERFMLHFAHFEKQAERIDKSNYLIKIKYSRDDETEMVIRILSFGPMIEVIGSESFRNLIIDRLKRQKSCGLQ